MPNAGIPRAAGIATRISAHLKHNSVDHAISSYNFDQPNELPDVTGFDLLIAIGGDGTLLRAGHLAGPIGLPLLGVQAGRLGFLVEVAESDLETRLEDLLSGHYRLEQRMMLDAEFHQAGEFTQRWDVVNEIVVARGHEIRPIEVRVDLSEGYMTSYIADGLIVSTATGSTGYALAAHGPILPPELRNMLLLPIAPHLSLDRAVVLAEGASVTLRTTGVHETVVSVDGMDPVVMTHEDTVKVVANKRSLQMVRFREPNYFYRDLAEVLQVLPQRKLT
ncbi:MAG: NAD(+)/NADH kinase [Anaerolineaceae bacterium]